MPAAGCGGHLGHVFAGERMIRTNERHCVNSVTVLHVAAETTEGVHLPLAEEVVTSKMQNQKLAKIKRMPL